MGQIKDLIIMQLYAYGSVNDKEEVVRIDFGYNKTIDNGDENVPIIIKLKPKEARVRK